MDNYESAESIISKIYDLNNAIKIVDTFDNNVYSQKDINKIAIHFINPSNCSPSLLTSLDYRNIMIKIYNYFENHISDKPSLYDFLKCFNTLSYQLIKYLINTTCIFKDIYFEIDVLLYMEDCKRYNTKLNQYILYFIENNNMNSELLRSLLELDIRYEVNMIMMIIEKFKCFTGNDIDLLINQCKGSNLFSGRYNSNVKNLIKYMSTSQQYIDINKLFPFDSYQYKYIGKLINSNKLFTNNDILELIKYYRKKTDSYYDSLYIWLLLSLHNRYNGLFPDDILISIIEKMNKYEYLCFIKEIIQLDLKKIYDNIYIPDIYNVIDIKRNLIKTDTVTNMISSINVLVDMFLDIKKMINGFNNFNRVHIDPIFIENYMIVYLLGLTMLIYHAKNIYNHDIETYLIIQMFIDKFETLTDDEKNKYANVFNTAYQLLGSV